MSPQEWWSTFALGALIGALVVIMAACASALVYPPCRPEKRELE